MENFTRHLLIILLCGAINLTNAQESYYEVDVTKNNSYTQLTNAEKFPIDWNDSTTSYVIIDLEQRSTKFFGQTFDFGQGAGIYLSNFANFQILNDNMGIVIDGYFTALDSTSPKSQVWGKISTIEGEDVLQVEFRDVGFVNCTFDSAYTNFQMWIYLGSGILEFRYGPNHIECAFPWFQGDSGPFIGLFRGNQNFSTLYQISWLTGDPASPDVNTRRLSSMDGPPEEGLMYRFIPKDATSAINEDLLANSIKVYPSVSDGSAVRVEQAQSLRFSVFDISGKILHEEIIKSEQQQLNLSDLKPGIYFYQLQDNNNVISTSKLIITE